MGLINLLKKKNRKLLFTTPSHGQKFFIFNKFRQFYKYDISETESHNPQEALLKAENKASDIYETTYTLFLTNGSTSGIIASILACTSSNDNILIANNAHPCHLNAVKLSGCKPIYYQIPTNEQWGCPDRTPAELIEKHLKNNKIKAVIITSPTYEGFVSDIESIKKVCNKYNSYLIVDEAHGALYPFNEKLPQSAVKIADFTVQSLHKTAGGLNPTALLHSNCNINPKDALNKINTTSPSYPLLASIEANINYLSSKKGRKNIDLLISNLKNLRNAVSNVEFGGDDITKILIKKQETTGIELSKILYEKFNIEDEKTNSISTMLLCGIGTSENYIKKLKNALLKL